MKKHLAIYIFFFAFVSNAQHSFFRGANNYVVPAVPFQAPALITNGLVLYLDAGNSASYSGTGTTWTNLVAGSAVPNFTLNNGVTYENVNGGVLRFSNGGWAYTTSYFGTLTNYTIEAWVKIAGTAPSPNGNYTPCIFSDKYNGSVNMILAYNGSNFTTSSNQYTTGYYNGGWNTFSTTSNTNDLNNWIHIVATYNGSICTIYKNGVNSGSGSIGSNPGSSNAGYFIGHRWDMNDLVYGDYAIVNLYTRALSSSEVTTNFNAVRSRFGL